MTITTSAAPDWLEGVTVDDTDEVVAAFQHLLVRHPPASFLNMRELREAHPQWFDRKTMLFFGTRAYPKIYGGSLFITQDDRYDALNSGHSVRFISSRGIILTVGKHSCFDDLEDAKASVKKLLLLLPPLHLIAMACAKDGNDDGQ